MTPGTANRAVMVASDLASADVAGDGDAAWTRPS